MRAYAKTADRRNTSKNIGNRKEYGRASALRKAQTQG